MSRVRVREVGEVRREKMIVATVAALAKHGAGRISVRLIANEAGVSPSLLTHYFESIENAVAAATGHLGDTFQASLSRAVERAGRDPKQRMAAFVGSCFRAPAAAPSTLRAWIAILGLSRSMPPVARSLDAAKARFVENAGRLMADLQPERCPRAGTVALIAAVEGLWIELAGGQYRLSFRRATDAALRMIDCEEPARGRRSPAGKGPTAVTGHR